jgi:hypothetical protein
MKKNEFSLESQSNVYSNINYIHAVFQLLFDDLEKQIVLNKVNGDSGVYI